MYCKLVLSHSFDFLGTNRFHSSLYLPIILILIIKNNISIFQNPMVTSILFKIENKNRHITVESASDYS